MAKAKNMSIEDLMSYAISTEAGQAEQARLAAENDTVLPNGAIVRRWSLRGETKFIAFRASDGKRVGEYPSKKEAMAKVS